MLCTGWNGKTLCVIRSCSSKQARKSYTLGKRT
uniref:Uncharacterized protein n=1 Tax=Anguilla anguilla TaxID=7936 RepID=A0A0E9XDX6_ANGAN